MKVEIQGAGGAGGKSLVPAGQRITSADFLDHVLDDVLGCSTSEVDSIGCHTFRVNLWDRGQGTGGHGTVGTTRGRGHDIHIGHHRRHTFRVNL